MLRLKLTLWETTVSDVGKSMRYRCNCEGKLYVKETRACDDAVYRVRKCQDCGELFTTKEVAIEGTIPHNVLPARVHKRRTKRKVNHE